MLDSASMIARVEEIVLGHKGMEGALLPILHAVQAEFGHVPEAALPVIAEALVITKAEAAGVMSFYHDFREKPAGRHVLKLCRGVSANRSGAMPWRPGRRRLCGSDRHETSKDGAVTLEPIFCLGLCACGPAALVDGKLVGRLDAAKLDAILGGLK